MDNSLHIGQLEQYFKKSAVFGNDELSRFYERVGGAITKSTLKWRIHNLVSGGYIKRKGHGLYSLGETIDFIPEVDSLLKKINGLLQKNFPFTKVCLWNTKVLNQWMLHQPSQFFTLVEVEKEATESVFHFLQEHFPQVFLRPDKEVLQRYALQKSNSIIVLPLISEAPVQKVKTITTVTLEKLIVDIFCEPDIFAAQQGSELAFIYNNIFSAYTISMTKILRYAGRRRKKEALINYLESNTNFQQHFKDSI